MKMTDFEKIFSKNGITVVWEEKERQNDKYSVSSDISEYVKGLTLSNKNLVYACAKFKSGYQIDGDSVVDDIIAEIEDSGYFDSEVLNMVKEKAKLKIKEYNSKILRIPYKITVTADRYQHMLIYTQNACKKTYESAVIDGIVKHLLIEHMYNTDETISSKQNGEKEMKRGN